MVETKKLSKMQKIILKEIGKEYFIDSMTLSKQISKMIDGGRMTIDRRKGWAEDDKMFGQPNIQIKLLRLRTKPILYFQTDSFRASLSRSLKRLIDRGLIKKDYRIHLYGYTLTIKGTEAFQTLFGVHPDDYNPC